MKLKRADLNHLIHKARPRGELYEHGPKSARQPSDTHNDHEMPISQHDAVTQEAPLTPRPPHHQGHHHQQTVTPKAQWPYGHKWHHERAPIVVVKTSAMTRMSAAVTGPR
jgi:hypothetical protein